MYCIHCGQGLPDEAKFCNRCGKTVTQQDGTYSYVYKKPKTNPSKTPSGSNAEHNGDTKVTSGTAAKTKNQLKTDPTPTAPRQEPGGMGCLSWILILACLGCLYSWVIHPIAKEKGWFGTDESTVVEEETKSQEEVEMENRAARLPGINDDHLDLPIFDNRQAGPCKTLEGDVGITILFMDDSESLWTHDKMDEFIAAVYNTCWELKDEAAGWGKDLNFNIQTAHGAVAEIVEPSLAYLSFQQHVTSAGYPSYTPDFLEQLRTQTHAESVPVIVAFNKPGRSYACPVTSESVTAEKCYIFDDTSALKHELLHLFGAADFYYHDYLDWAVGHYLGDSIMASTGGPVDDMTAYLIGWTDTLSDDASLFVYSADFVGKDAMQAADQDNALNGYATKTFDNGAVYTGTLSMGVPNGTGETIWPNGDRYNGDWDQGQRTGYGTFYWADGTVYEGQFLDGNMHGQGTITYYNGQVQSGYWENGEFIG